MARLFLPLDLPLFLVKLKRIHQKQADRFPFGLDLIAVAPRFDFTSQRRCHQKLDALGHQFINHGAEHKSSTLPKQDA